MRRAQVYDDPDYRPPEDSWAMNEGYEEVFGDASRDPTEEQPPPVEYAPSHDQPAESNQDPQQFVEDTKRWSYHLANDPYGGAAGAWAKSFYDNPNIDPGSAIQEQIAAFRRQYGDAAPEDDIGVMQMIATGQRPQASSKPPSQQWGDFNSGSSPSWLTTTAPGSSSPTSETVAPPVPGTSTPTPTPEVGESGKALLELLMGRARQGLAVGRDDPNVRAQVDPAAAQMERARRNYLDTAAERSGGRPYNIAGEERMTAERLGQESGLLESQVIGREIGARRDEIQNALTQWGGMLTNEQKLGLERELGYLTERIQGQNRQAEVDWRNADRQRGYDEFLRQMALREWEAENQDYYYRSGLIGGGGY